MQSFIKIVVQRRKLVNLTTHHGHQWIFSYAFFLIIHAGRGSWIFRISSDPVRVFQGSSTVFIWGLREDLISQPAFKGLTFGLWKNGHLTTYIISLTKSGRIIPNPDPDDQLKFFAGRVQWIGNLTKSFAAFEVSQISARDQMDYGIQLHFGAFKDPVSDFVRLEVVGKLHEGVFIYNFCLPDFKQQLMQAPLGIYKHTHIIIIHCSNQSSIRDDNTL